MVRTCASLHIQQKSWNKLPHVTANKPEIVRFLASQWRTEAFRGKLSNRIVWQPKITAGVQPQANANQLLSQSVWFFMLITREAHASVIHSKDIVVFIFLLALSQSLGRCCLKRRRGAKTRILELSAVVNSFGKATPFVYCLFWIKLLHTRR